MKTVVAFFLLTLTSLGAHAQNWPTQTVRLVVPFSAGGPSDITARIVADEMSRQLNQPVIVENRAGAGSAVGSASVAKAERDGHTILFTTNSLSLMSSLMANLNFDPQADFTPVALVGTSSYILATNNEFPARTLAEVLSLVRGNPNKFNYGSAGVGSGMHFAFEYFLATAGSMKMMHVPYRGGAAVMAALMGGEVHLVTDPTPEAIPYILNGNLRPIAVSSRERLPNLPDLPTFAESGVPELSAFQARGWHMMLVPSGTPAPLVVRINEAINNALTSPRLASRLTEMSIQVPRDNSPEATARFLESEFRLWGEVAKKAGIKPG
jgi:tripartite-type tricarboxylate transporter receptor subunit TctC